MTKTADEKQNETTEQKRPDTGLTGTAEAKPAEAPPKRKRGRPPGPPKPPHVPDPTRIGRPRPDIDPATGRYIARGNIMSDSEMDKDNISHKMEVRNPLYSRNIDSGDKISLLISGIREEMESVGKKISFANTELVRETVIRYLKSCERTGALPTKIGLCRACGCGRAAMDRYLREHPEHPTSQFLEIVCESFSEALSQASLNGSVQPIVAIFLQKALYAMRENEPTPQKREDPLGEFTDTESIARKYGEIAVDEEN